MFCSLPSGRKTVYGYWSECGYYTERFSKLARQVVAFDPVVEHCRQIESRNMAN